MTRKTRRNKTRKLKKRSYKKGGEMCDWDSECPKGSWLSGRKHNWGLTGVGTYVCKNGCGCLTYDH